MNYLPEIKKALKKFYENDSILIRSKLHEMTFVYRIAKYLSEQLENNGNKIDCEYHGMIKEDEVLRKSVEWKTGERIRIRPDIIYHQRSQPGETGHNFFCIEVKLRSPGEDKNKVRDIMNELNYEQGFCICNVGKNYITVYEIIADNGDKKHRYKIKSLNNEITLEEVNNG